MLSMVRGNLTLEILKRTKDTPKTRGRHMGLQVLPPWPQPGRLQFAQCYYKSSTAKEKESKEQGRRLLMSTYFNLPPRLLPLSLFLQPFLCAPWSSLQDRLLFLSRWVGGSGDKRSMIKAIIAISKFWDVDRSLAVYNFRNVTLSCRKRRIHLWLWRRWSWSCFPCHC